MILFVRGCFFVLSLKELHTRRKMSAESCSRVGRLFPGLAHTRNLYSKYSRDGRGQPWLYQLSHQLPCCCGCGICFCTRKTDWQIWDCDDHSHRPCNSASLNRFFDKRRRYGPVFHYQPCELYICRRLTRDRHKTGKVFQQAALSQIIDIIVSIKGLHWLIFS